MVAKSYQKRTLVGDPYVGESGKMYQKVLNENTGKTYEVRWYSAAEYAKMYPGEVVEEDPFSNQKNILGFKDGYITIFKGDQEKYEDWFNRSIARYCVYWGWYIVSEDMVPFDLPAGLEPVRLDWNIVGIGSSLRATNEVRAAITNLLSNASKSKFKGSVGERLTLTLTVIKSSQTQNHFGGHTAKHIFEDSDGNQYYWETGAKFWAEGSIKTIRATVKEHRVINNIQTTILQRCIES